MVRISGVDLQENGVVQYALTKLYGIGRNNALVALEKASISPIKRVKELTEQEVTKLQQIIDKDFIVEGDLRRAIGETIKRLKVINSYRGIRHTRGLPVRGQRTKTNARTRRGKRKTVGALKKEDRAKVDAPESK
jgi:small subunit ribosomal protein S13